MAADKDDLIQKTGASTVTTLSAPGKAMSATSITVGSTTNYPSDTGVTIAIRVVDSDGELVPGTYTEWSAVVTTGTTLGIDAVPVFGSDQVYAAGSTTQVFIPLSSYAHNRFVDGFGAEHSLLDGTHTDVTATTVTADSFITTGGAAADKGWDVGLGDTPDTVTNNGNRSYDLVFNGVDHTDVISPGMRFRTERTVAAPDQCADLDRGSSQYFSATTPGYSFTDDFVVSAWVKLESYASASIQGIASVYNGTSGFALLVNTDGTIRLQGNNAGSGNVSYVDSYQSIPLGRWVHIAAQLDMSAFTATTTTSYVMLDGVDVPATVARAGTNPTAIVQAGNLEIGSYNGGTNPLDGKIAQVGIFNAKVTQATIQDYMTHGLDGTETNNDGAWSLDNVITDLNSNANDLTAQGGAVATDTDSPFGDGGTSTTLDYGIVTAASFSTNTTVTVQVPEGCTIPTTGGVTSVAYSTDSCPYGFVRGKSRWEIILYDASSGSFTSTDNWQTVNNMELVVPTGDWNMQWAIFGVTERTGGSAAGSMSSVSTTTGATTIGGNQKTVFAQDTGSVNFTAATQAIGSTDISVSAATTYYGVWRQTTTSSVATRTWDHAQSGSPGFISAIPNYL